MYQLIWKKEVIDEFETKEEAVRMRIEYNLAFGGGVTIKKK